LVEWQGFWIAVFVQTWGAFTTAFVALATWAAFATALATISTFAALSTFSARLALFVAAFGAIAALFAGHAFVAGFGASFGLGFR
jgi:hypothetical protein